MIKDNGEIPLANADEANVPVNIFLTNEKDGKWHLRADNFMPRNSYATDGAYKVTVVPNTFFPFI